MLHDVGLGAALRPNYGREEDETRHQDVVDPDSSNEISNPSTEGGRRSQRQLDPRVLAVRADERAGYEAGVDAIASSESRSRDTSEHGSLSRRSSTTSSYAPSSSTSTTESTPPSWALAITSRIDQLSNTLSEVVRTQTQHNEMLLRTPFPGHSYGWQQPPPFIHHGFPPMAPYMPAPMGFTPASMQDDYRPAPSRQMPDTDHTMAYSDKGVSFHDQLGTVSPSMLHTARPRGGMRGAPELAPEDIGNVAKFNEFLQRHASYAASAREQNQSWASVAGLLARYAEDLAVAFNACALKRQEPPHFDSHTVLQLSDDVFERLYLEACAPTVEYPSQVLQVLETIAFIRQQPHESSPMPAILRAAEAFRVQLRLLPTRAVSECKEDALAMAFMTLLFGDSAKNRSNDFQRCTSWIQLKDALIRSAASNPSWFGTALHPPSSVPSAPTAAQTQSTPSSQHSASTSVSQPAGHDPQDAKRMADRVARMKASGELKGFDIEGLSDKSILKLVNKAKWRTKIGEQAVEQARAAGTLDKSANKLHDQLQEQAKAIAALTAQLRQRSDSRDRQYDRPRDDRPREDRTRVEDRARDDRQRDDRLREDRYHDRVRSGDRSVERPRSQEPAPDPKTPPRSQAFAPNTSPSASQRQSSPGTRRV
jgi:hypothetical protein